jgi:hypothetical protein
MAKILVDDDMIGHLRGPKTGTLCGAVVFSDEAKDGTMTCKACGDAALKAIELSTKAERREWRRL